MTQEKHVQAETSRALDPNAVQRKAANPEASVWVSASAGTGKTKVLTDRVLRLLLPRTDGQPGTKPHKILGITFTKAAASEMAMRITARLSSWAIMPLETLEKDLTKLLNKKPTSQDIKAARQLFADVVDTPGGLKIMTIHAFCQSVLGRFPLEAGLPPYFSVLEDHQAREMLQQAQSQVIAAAQKEKGSALAESFTHIAGTINEQQFLSLLQDIVSQRSQFEKTLKQHFGVEGLYTALCKELAVKPGQTRQTLLEEACKPVKFDLPSLEKAATALGQSSKKTDLEKAAKINAWLTATPQKRTQTIDTYISAFLTAKGQMLKTLATKEAQNHDPDILHTLGTEAQRLIALEDQVKAINCAILTRDILRLGEAALHQYQSLKQKAATLDFDDLILKTNALLTDSASWVLYKMDQGLEHILLDEAQDTNPDQWSIVESLCTEFFSGQGRDEKTRTVFVVGDEKQSIYSFQRSSPEDFTQMRENFKEKIRAAKENWEPVDLDISFRSAKSVLQAVDAVFADPALRKGLSLKDIQHRPYRSGAAGRVELWPVFESTDKTETDLWTPPTEIIANPSGQAKLADHLAETIASWIKNKHILPSKNRPITPGDIMILMRSRTSLVSAISRALKARDIAVSGSDRMILNDQLAIEDLLALAQFAVLPADDLTLACVLKFPLINLSEEQLFTFAHKRTASLWTAIQAEARPEITEYLTQLITHAGNMQPFEFFSFILQTPCPANPQSGIQAIQARLGPETLDPIQEMLRAALDFEQRHTPSLQGFIAWQTGRQEQIKREMEEAGNQVRIMTVHGSKGLQAPIVIMPDTMRTTTSPPGQIDKRLIWPDKSELSLPIWSPRKDRDPALFSAQMDKLDTRLDEEYRRLLYVAMTRAEDRLYITGYAGHKTPLENSWYHFIKSGLSALPNIEEKNGILILDNPQTKDIKEKKEERKPTGQFLKIPDFLYKKPEKEASTAMPSSPSRLSPDPEDAAISPLKNQSNYRFRRGNVTHKLLEILPNIAPEKRTESATYFLEHFAHDLPHDIRSNIVSETLNILEHPDFAQIFTSESRAEVPVSGYLKDGQLISGQIDRLLITENEILIIDFKTNRPPPKNPADIPAIYQKQMQAYGDTLQHIYPGRTVKAALLWTDGPYLMPVSFK